MKITERGKRIISVFSLISVVQNTDETLFIVSDTGMGIPDDIIEKRFSGATMTPGEMKIFTSHAATGESIVKRIPRFANISEAIGKQFVRFEDCDCSNKEITQIANILKVVNDYTYLETLGLSIDNAIESMQRRIGHYDKFILDAIKSELKGIEEGFILRSVRLDELELESIIAEDIKSEKDVLLVRKGSEVTKVLKIILKNFSMRSKIREPIKVLVKH